MILLILKFQQVNTRRIKYDYQYLSFRNELNFFINLFSFFSYIKKESHTRKIKLKNNGECKFTIR